MAAAAAAAGGDSTGKQKKAGGVRWRSILYNQTWGGLVVLAVACALTGVAHFLSTPAVRPIRMYDAAISLPPHPDSVSIVAAGLIPFGVLVLTVVLVEFAALHKWVFGWCLPGAGACLSAGSTLGGIIRAGATCLAPNTRVARHGNAATACWVLLQHLAAAAPTYATLYAACIDPLHASPSLPTSALLCWCVSTAAARRKQSLTMALHATFHIIYWAIIGFMVVLAVTEATKPFASRLRPDFMSRCKPSSQRPGEVLTLDQPVDCAGASNKEVFDDGRCAAAAAAARFFWRGLGGWMDGLMGLMAKGCTRRRGERLAHGTRHDTPCCCCLAACLQEVISFRPQLQLDEPLLVSTTTTTTTAAAASRGSADNRRSTPRAHVRVQMLQSPGRGSDAHALPGLLTPILDLCACVHSSAPSSCSCSCMVRACDVMHRACM